MVLSFLDFMESLEISLAELDAMWGSRIRSLLVNPPHDELKVNCDFSGFGMVTSSASDGLQMEIGVFRPFHGVELRVPGVSGSVSYEGQNFPVVPPKSWIGFASGFIESIEPLVIKLTLKSSLWIIPEMVPDMAFSACHLFSGAVCGWSRAMQWLQSKAMVHLDKTVVVDSDETAMRVWDLQQQFDGNSDVKIYYGDVCITSQLKQVNGVVGPVGNPSWYNLCRVVPNLIFTLSPPCQTWSAGGRLSGFQHWNGFAMVEAIEGIKRVRPLAACFECADKIVVHPHYPLLKKLLLLCGYRLAWTSVTTLHNLSGMFRTRWLAVWVRLDLPHSFVQSITTFGSVKSASWDHQMYDFTILTIPDQLEHQLILTPGLCSIYGDVRLLPRNKLSCLGNNPTTEDVLLSRCLKKGEVMPTVVASYSKQHEIANDHIAARGIFAYLVNSASGVAFVDPFRCLALMGIPVNQCAFVARKLDVAFRHIGNALSVQQALMCLLVACQCFGINHGSVQNIAVDCWMSRISAGKVLILRTKDFFVVSPPKMLNAFFHEQGPIKVDNDEPLRILLPNDDLICTFQSNATFKDLVHCLGFEKPGKQGITCHHQSGEIRINDLVGMYGDCSFCIRFKGIDVLQIVSCKTTGGLQEISPTIPFCIHDENCEVIETYTCDVQVIDDLCHETKTEIVHRVTILVCGVDKPIFAVWKDELDEDRIEMLLRKEVCEVGSKVPIRWCQSKICSHDSHDEKLFLVEIAPALSPLKKLVRVLHSGEFQQSIVGIVNGTTPIQIALAVANGCESAMINDSPIHLLQHVHFEDGDCIQFGTSPNGHITENARKKIVARVQNLRNQGSKLGIDELLFCRRILGTENPMFRLCDPVLIDDRAFVDGFFVKAIQQGFLQFQLRPEVAFAVPILINDHWFAVEVHPISNRLLVIGLPPHYQRVVLRLLSERTHERAVMMKIEFIDIHFNGLCGWALLHRWFAQLDAHFPNLPVDLCFEMIGQTQADFVNDIPLADMSKAFPIARFALEARNAFILAMQTTHASYGLHWISVFGLQPPSGGTMSDSPGPSPDAMIDRVFLADPWARDRKQCKWQDLHLPKDHPFVLSDGKPASQVHRQKMGPNMGGIAFGTRSCITEIMKMPPKEPAAILLPVSEKESKIDVIPQPKIQGPFEVVVEDSSTGAIYKRQVQLVEISQGISYVLPKPEYEAKLSEVREVVLEIDTRLVTKEVANSLQEKPIDVFRSKILDQFPPSAFKSSNLYGYRRFVPKMSVEDHCIHQIMCKLPLAARKSVLERSGVGIMTVRDFVPRGGSIDDVTTIPRFWSVDRQSKDDALRTTSGLDGFMGLVVTKRGIAARCTTGKIAVLRKALMPMDERIIPLNENTVPRVIVESTGWPMAISPEEVVKATHHAVKKAPIPMRCYRSFGVTSWSLAFDSLPQLLKFTAKFNDEVCEILLTQNKQPKLKAQRTFNKQVPYSKTSQLPQNASPADDDTIDRLGALESKVANMEKRQDALETRISTGFDSVSDQLRQVLNAVQQRPKSPSGETPPPKMSKVSN